MTREEKARHILESSGLLGHLKHYGRPHVIGSCRMGVMAWNDIDIDIENHGMTLEKLYHLTRFIIDAFHPFWYEAKEEMDGAGKNVWFHGFEAMIDGERWNFDLWFFDRETIRQAEEYCDGIAARATAPQKEAIVRLKKGLLEMGLYSFDKFRSVDVYRAVLEENAEDVQAFLEKYGKKGLP